MFLCIWYLFDQISAWVFVIQVFLYSGFNCLCCIIYYLEQLSHAIAIKFSKAHTITKFLFFKCQLFSKLHAFSRRESKLRHKSTRLLQNPLRVSKKKTIDFFVLLSHNAMYFRSKTFARFANKGHAVTFSHIVATFLECVGKATVIKKYVFLTEVLEISG